MDYKRGAFLYTLLQVLLWQPVLMQWSFSVPRDIKALEGSCVVIPCTFTGSILRPDGRLTFTWSLWSSAWYDVVHNKDPTNVLPEYKGRALLVGDLEGYNCTLQINNVTKKDDDRYYYPKIERTYSNYVLIHVSDTPGQPKVVYPQTMTEGVPEKVTCSVKHTCPAHPPSLAWDKIKGNVNVYHEDLSDGIWRTVLVLNYTPIAEHHMEDFVCSATYPSGKSASQSITLSIRYAPKNTTAAEFHPHQIIKEGDTVTLSCSSRGNPSKSTYGWFEGPQKTTTLGYAPLLTLRNISWDSGPYICTATNDVGIGESPPLHLNIQHAPKGVDVVLLGDPEEGKPMELLCATKSSNPTETYFTWYKNGKVTQEGKTLKIESTIMDDAGVYHCMAQNALGNTSSTPVSINVKPAQSSTNFVILGGVAAAIFLILFLLVIVIIIRGRKKKAPLLAKDNTQPAATEYDRQHVGNNEEIWMKEHLYGTIDNYIHVRDENQRRSVQEYPELIDPYCSVEKGYSQLPGREHEQQVSEELNYATIQHFERPKTSPTDSSGEEKVEYATVKR